MFNSPFSLGQLGWRPFYAQQLTLSELEASFPARVVGVQRSGVTVLSERGGGPVSLAGTFSPDAYSASVTVGDWLLIDRTAPRALRALNRYSVIERIAAGDGARRQLIAANLDTLFITTSCNEDLNASRLERYLTLARDAQVEPVIVLTKADLCSDVQRYLDDSAAVAANAQVLALDATAANAASALRAWLQRGQTVAFVGSSGVGKSTLVNTLLGAIAQQTGGVREHDGKGRHTTAAREMFALPSGAWVIDTPGMRELRVGAVEWGLAAVFQDIETLARDCRFRDCRHEEDNGCAISVAIAAGKLDARRLESYLKLRREAARAAQSLRERRELERHLGRVHRSTQRVQRRRKGRQ